MKYSPLFFGLAAMFFFASCGQKEVTGLPIPKNAITIVHVNGASINSKASWKDIGMNNWFGSDHDFLTDSAGKNLLTDPEKSGIDIASDFIFFKGKKSNISYQVFEGFLKDANAFEETSKKLHPAAEIQKRGDFKFQKTGVEQIVSWNKSKFIFMSGQTMMNQRLDRRNVQTPGLVPVDSLVQFTENLFELKEEESIDKNEIYSTLLKEKADVHMWMNSSLMLSTMGIGPMALLSASPLMQGLYSTTTINFENGKIVAHSKQYFGEAMSKVMEKHPVKNVTKELLNRIPSKDVAGAFAWSFNPETVREFFSAAGINPDSYLKQYNTSLDQIVKATNGQLLFSFTPSQEKKSPASEDNMLSTMMPYGMNTLLAIAVKDQTAFEQLINVLKDLFLGDERGAQLPIPYKLSNEWFAVGTSTKQVDSFMTGSTNDLPFADRISGEPVGGYIDLQKLLNASRTNIGDSAEIEIAKKTWQDVVVKGGIYKDRSMSLNTEINFIDKSTNSLKQLGQYLSEINALENKRLQDRTNKVALNH